MEEINTTPDMWSQPQRTPAQKSEKTFSQRWQERFDAEKKLSSRVIEFLFWLDHEVPEGTQTADLSHDFAEKLRSRLNALAGK